MWTGGAHRPCRKKLSPYDGSDVVVAFVVAGFAVVAFAVAGFAVAGSVAVAFAAVVETVIAVVVEFAVASFLVVAVVGNIAVANYLNILAAALGSSQLFGPRWSWRTRRRQKKLHGTGSTLENGHGQLIQSSNQLPVVRILQ